jgi:hypothetical protein
LTKKGKSGEDVDIIKESLGLDNTILIEALDKLERLKRIQWLDDATIFQRILKLCTARFIIYTSKKFFLFFSMTDESSSIIEQKKSVL